MSVEAFVGLVGGGKSYNSVRRMMAYMARGGRVCSNILLTGFNDAIGDFSEDSPVLPFLRSIGWEYQRGQYTYIPFEMMASDPFWIKRVPAGIDRDHRTLLVVDEATDLFDSLDGGRLRVDVAYREIFHFLRLSRHVHVDVLFIAQDISSINSRLKGLVSFIWRSTDMKKFRMPKLRVPFPFDLFMLQQFDRTGKYEVRREWVKKDYRVFTLYESEAFNNSLSVKWDGVAIDSTKGLIKGGQRKMTKTQMFLLLVALGLSVYSAFRPSSVQSGGGSVVTNVVYSVSSTNAPSASVVSDGGSVLVVRGAYSYQKGVNGESVVFSNAVLRAGLPCEYGYVKSVSESLVQGETFDGGIFYLLPEYVSPSVKSSDVFISLVEGEKTPPRAPF